MSHLRRPVARAALLVALVHALSGCGFVLAGEPTAQEVITTTTQPSPFPEGLQDGAAEQPPAPLLPPEEVPSQVSQPVDPSTTRDRLDELWEQRQVDRLRREVEEGRVTGVCAAVQLATLDGKALFDLFEAFQPRQEVVERGADTFLTSLRRAVDSFERDTGNQLGVSDALDALRPELTGSSAREIADRLAQMLTEEGAGFDLALGELAAACPDISGIIGATSAQIIAQLNRVGANLVE